MYGHREKRLLRARARVVRFLWSRRHWALFTCVTCGCKIPRRMRLWIWIHFCYSKHLKDFALTLIVPSSGSIRMPLPKAAARDPFGPGFCKYSGGIWAEADPSCWIFCKFVILSISKMFLQHDKAVKSLQIIHRISLIHQCLVTIIENFPLWSRQKSWKHDVIFFTWQVFRRVEIP